MLSRLSSISVTKRIVCVLALGIIMVSGVAAWAPEQTRTAPPVATVNQRVPATYDVTVGLDGEIYPAFANFASLRRVRERKWGTVTVRVNNNSSELLRNRIT